MAAFPEIGKLLAVPRKWIVTIIACSIIVTLLTTGARWRPRHRDLAFPIQLSPLSTLEFQKQVLIKDLVKPPNITVVALVFFGRKSRVEMLRCYIEVSQPTLGSLTMPTDACPAQPSG